MLCWLPLVTPSPQMLSHMCDITRAGIKPQDFTVLNVFYLSFTERLWFTEENPPICVLDQKIENISFRLYGRWEYMLLNKCRANAAYASRVRGCITVSRRCSRPLCAKTISSHWGYVMDNLFTLTHNCIGELKWHMWNFSNQPDDQKINMLRPKGLCLLHRVV